MEQPVDLTSLREITGGDKELEQELFRSFLESSGECLQALRVAFGANDEGQWRNQAHALKGVCLNVGAAPLAMLCKRAQEDFRASTEEKKPVLDAIESEYMRVRAAFENVL